MTCLRRLQPSTMNIYLLATNFNVRDCIRPFTESFDGISPNYSRPTAAKIDVPRAMDPFIRGNAVAINVTPRHELHTCCTLSPSSTEALSSLGKASWERRSGI